VKASDLYGSSIGSPTTQSETMPQQGAAQRTSANNTATGMKAGGATMVSIMCLVGVLIGAKLTLEKS
jgi:hypothetical protein